jgi:hypothetical protein
MRSLFLIVLFYSFFIESCAFDPPNGEQIELGNNYFACFSTYSINNGITIEYSKDKQIFMQVASNCIKIYQDTNVIAFSKKLGKIDTIYFLIDKKRDGKVKKIKKNNFKKVIVNLDEVKIKT